MQRICKWCGKQFNSDKALRGGVYEAGRYCSKRCEIAGERQRQSEREERRKKIEEIKSRGGLGAKLLLIWDIIKWSALGLLILGILYVVISVIIINH